MLNAIVCTAVCVNLHYHIFAVLFQCFHNQILFIHARKIVQHALPSAKAHLLTFVLFGIQWDGIDILFFQIAREAASPEP